MPLIDFCLKPITADQIDVNRSILAGALHVALGSEIWPRDPRDLQSVTRLRGGITLVDVAGSATDLADDEGMITVGFMKDPYSEWVTVDLILADVMGAAPIACIRNIQPSTQGVEMFAIQKMAEAASSVISHEDPIEEASAQLLRDWILVAAFGAEATGEG